MGATAFDALRTIVLACVALHGSGCQHGSADAKGYCSFPRFLWGETGVSEGPSSSRKWIGQTEYFGNTDTWVTQLVITAQATEIVVKRKVHVPCTQQRQTATNDKLPPCYRQDTVYSIICLSEEPNGNYRVQQLHHQEKLFTCLKFEKQNSNLIQVYRAELNVVNKDRLCYDESLTRDDWPWRASERHDWSNCSLRGGFDFYSYAGHTNQQHCPEVWRPSRLESECLSGDGLNFIFPNHSCGIFYHPIQEQQFRCFSSWQDAGFTFILFGEAKLEARYILRLPSSPVDRFSAFLYLSPVAPIGDRGQVSAKTSSTTSRHVTFYELRMKRSESGVCYDESERCTEHARKGKCTNAVPFEYANYCKKSCRLCDFVVSDGPECKFPDEFIGRWVLFSPTEKEGLSIDIDGRIRFSSLGRFVCKNRHWQNDYYKLFTAFDNGCRPRHTCIMLSQGNDETLTMRMSSSDRRDRSFDLCEAHGDQDSFGAQVRNWKPKVLLPLSSLADVSCGLGRYMPSEVSFSGGLQCSGYISDISPTNCSASTQLSVNISGCRYRQQLDFECVALAKVSERINFLVTKVPNDALINSEQIVCWLVVWNSGPGVQSSSSALVTFQRARCDTREQILISKSTRDILYIKAFRAPPNATALCNRQSFAAESNEVHAIDNRPSQSALLSYVHQSGAQSRTPASKDPTDDDNDDSPARDGEPLGQRRQKAFAPPHAYEGDDAGDDSDSAAAQSDDRGPRTNGKSKAPNYRSVDEDEARIVLGGRDDSMRAMGDQWLVAAVNVWLLTVSLLGRCCWWCRCCC